MRIFSWALAALLLLASGAQAQNQTAPSADESANPTQSWAPGPLIEGSSEPPPGRVASRAVGVALTLPESWRAEDVSWRELDAEEAKALNELAESALVIEFKGKRGAVQPLLTVMRVPLKPWREAARKQTVGPGRITLTSAETGYAVIRSPEPTSDGRYADLRYDLEDAVGTLALYDAHRENRHLVPRIESDFNGSMGDGSPVKMHLSPSGKMTLTWGKNAEVLEGLWFQRGAQVVARLIRPRVHKAGAIQVDPEILLHYDGRNLIVINWDQKVLGPASVRLEPAP